MVVLGVTPARGGSKGVPRKNIRPLCGQPLLAWTARLALRARSLTRYLVSTEDAEIASVARACGADVLDRPVELATDRASTLAVLQHALEHVPADVVVVLQATSPIRDAELIDRCVARFLAERPDSLATGFDCHYHPYGASGNLPRQELSSFFYDDGSVYVIDADRLRAGDRFGHRRAHHYTDREQNLEIDDAFDFWIVEQVLARRVAEGRQAC